MVINKREGIMFFGVISLITVLLVLIFTCFSLLSYMSAKNDLALAQKSLSAQLSYTKAQTTLSEILDYIDKQLKEGQSADLSEAKFLQTEINSITQSSDTKIEIKPNDIYISVRIDDNRILYVEAAYSDEGISFIEVYKTINDSILSGK